MRSITSWLLTIAAIAFWIFRIGILACATLSIELPIKPIDAAIEIPMLFITLICLILIFKRSIIGGILYFAMYAGYFGMDIYNTLNATGLTVNAITLNILISVFAVIIAFANLLDIAISGNKSTVKATKPTDWFYQNEKFDRELDERADKNNYRIQ